MADSEGQIHNFSIITFQLGSGGGEELWGPGYIWLWASRWGGCFHLWELGLVVGRERRGLQGEEGESGKGTLKCSRPNKYRRRNAR